MKNENPTPSLTNTAAEKAETAIPEVHLELDCHEDACFVSTNEFELVRDRD